MAFFRPSRAPRAAGRRAIRERERRRRNRFDWRGSWVCVRRWQVVATSCMHTGRQTTWWTPQGHNRRVRGFSSGIQAGERQNDDDRGLTSRGRPCQRAARPFARARMRAGLERKRRGSNGAGAVQEVSRSSQHRALPPSTTHRGTGSSRTGTRRRGSSSRSCSSSWPRRASRRATPAPRPASRS